MTNRTEAVETKAAPLITLNAWQWRGLLSFTAGTSTTGRQRRHAMADRTDTFYAAEGAIHGYGAQLMVGDGASPEVFEAIAGVVRITPGAMETADIDRTHLRSPDAHREHMPGMRDSGAFQVEGVWLPEEQSQSNEGGGTGPFASGGLVALWRGRLTHNFRIMLPIPGSPDGIFWPFRGYVSAFQPGEMGPDDKINFTAGFMPTQAYDASLP